MTGVQTCALPISTTFRNYVQTGGPWDYKQQGAQFENFGNFNYGATGNAYGWSLNSLLNEAGRAQIEAHTSSPAYGKPSSRWDMLLHGIDGTGSRGDEPKDQEWIQRGYKWYNNNKSQTIPFTPPIRLGY